MMIVVSFVVAILNILELLLVVRCLMSWFPQVQVLVKRESWHIAMPFWLMS